ncbi:MAG TPA: 50S ribosomal protein L29 [bacterium]|nr:50S ribosomal protein L29 [bacterium]
MEYRDLQNKSEHELHLMLAEKRVELKDLRFKSASNQLKAVRSIRTVRQLIARVLTLLNNRQK